MEQFLQNKQQQSQVTVTNVTSSIADTSQTLRTRSGRILEIGPPLSRHRKNRPKTFTGKSSLNGSLIKASWPSPSHCGNSAQSSSSNNSKTAIGISHYSSVANLNFGIQLASGSNADHDEHTGMNLASSVNDSNFGSIQPGNVFGDSGGVFATSSSHLLMHRDSDTEEAMDIDSQEEMDTHSGHTCTVTVSSITTPITSASIHITSQGKDPECGQLTEGAEDSTLAKSEKDTPSSTKVPTPLSAETHVNKKTEKDLNATSANKPPSISTENSKSKTPVKKKAIYILLHVGTVTIGDLIAKASAPVKIYAEKVFLELELDGGREPLSLKIPWKDFSECLVSFESPHPVIAFTLTKTGAKMLLDKNKGKGSFLDHESEGYKRRRLVLNLNYNSMPRDAKADFIELFQKRMSATIAWKELSPTEIKAALNLEVPEEKQSSESKEDSIEDEVGSTSPNMAPSPSVKEGRKILTPKKCSGDVRRKLFRKSASSPSNSSSVTNNDEVDQLSGKSKSSSSIKVEITDESESQIQTRSRRRKAEAMEPTTITPSPEEEYTNLSPLGKHESFPSLPSEVKRDMFSRLTSNDIRDIFPPPNLGGGQDTFPRTASDLHVFPGVTSDKERDSSPSTEEKRDISSDTCFNGDRLRYRDTEEKTKDVTPPEVFRDLEQGRDVFHHHTQMESHISLLGKHSEKQRYTLEQHQKLLSLERVARSRNMETIQDLQVSVQERDQNLGQLREEIRRLDREMNHQIVTITHFQQELLQERESLSRLRKVQTDLTQARRALDEEKLVRSLRDRQLQEKESTVIELRRALAEETQARRNIEDELRRVRGACLQHMDELENQRLFRQTQDREIQGREDRIQESERQFQEERAARLTLEEEIRRLRHDLDEERCSKNSIEGELARECERISEERTTLSRERQSYEQRLRDSERTVVESERRMRELQTAVGNTQSMLEEHRRLEPRDWLVRREEVTLTEITLGTGAWGSVKVGKFRGSPVAVKQIHELILSPHNRRLFEREMNIAARCRHPCLLQFIGATNDDGIPLFLTEILDSDLRAVLTQRSLHQEEIITIATDIARALNYLHLNKPFPIIHRDISSSNVLLWKRDTCWRAKLSDYGAANFMRQYMTVNPGAGIYAAPEASTSQQSPKVDVYSFGLLLCEMCVRELPVPQQIQEQVGLVTSGVLRELVVRCVQGDPEARPNMGEVITLLEQQEKNLRDRGLVCVNGRSATL